jgi:hypothetical protein
MKSAFELAIVVAAAAGTALAAPGSPEPSAVLKAIDACRTIAEDKARLTCFDAAAGRLAVAQEKDGLVVVDREQVRAARREAFGFNLPSLALLGRLAPEAANGESDDAATFTVAGARQGPNGRWVVVMDNGMVWRQTNDPIGAMSIRRGEPAAVRKGSLGAYFMTVGRHRAIKVERTR